MGFSSMQVTPVACPGLEAVSTFTGYCLKMNGDDFSFVYAIAGVKNVIWKEEVTVCP